MSNSRRSFLRASAAAAGAAGSGLTAQTDHTAGLPPARPSGTVQVPRMKFGGVEISRLILGCNQFYGMAHYNAILAALMREWYTENRVCEVLHRCASFGINAFNYIPTERARADWERYRREGGNMHLIAQGTIDPEIIVRTVQPLAIYHNGAMTDRAFRNGQAHLVREYCKELRQLGVMVGVGTHKPEVIAKVEEQGWDVDFYAGSIYNKDRTPEEFRNLLGGELPLPANEVYLEADPARMYKVMRQTAKPCFAFKILAAGRIERAQDIDHAFLTAFESLKLTDGVFVGMFPKLKDEIRDNAERVHRILSRA